MVQRGSELQLEGRQWEGSQTQDVNLVHSNCELVISSLYNRKPLKESFERSDMMVSELGKR